MQDANDFINFAHNAINNLQMPSDKAQQKHQEQAPDQDQGCLHSLSHGLHVSYMESH